LTENKNCGEFLENYDKALVNCATCKRWLFKIGKCREEIWVKEWLAANVGFCRW